MPKIDESKLADILNSLLTDNILRGESLIQNLDKSASDLSKTVKALDCSVTARAAEVKELAKILANAPKLGKTIKISAILASFVAGVAFAAAVYAWPLVSITHKFIQAEIDSAKYTELENYVIKLQNDVETYKNELTVYIRTFDRLNDNYKDLLGKVLQEERQKIQQEKESK